MKIKSVIQKAKSVPTAVILKKISESLNKSLSEGKQRLKDKSHCTYSHPPYWLIDLPYSYFKPPEIDYLFQNKNDILTVTNLILNHYFNLLGSGWVKIEQGMKAAGIEKFVYPRTEIRLERQEWLHRHINPNNYEESTKILKLVDSNYQMLDWQIDFRSGFRWKENIWYKALQYGNSSGADIKIPWELGRMQHLPILAYAYFFAKNEVDDFREPEVYRIEFRNQILDFIASNPPRYGVQWKTAMDTAIRAVSWLAAYEIFKSYGAEFDEDFNKIFIKSIYEHGLHIINNLEWSGGMRGNHYLANISGLLIIAAELPISEITTQWIAFSIQELINEIDAQFLSDGGNFEASTNYHCFAADMVFHAVTVVLLLPEEKILALKNYKLSKLKINKRLLPLNKQRYNISLDNKLIFPDNTVLKLQKIADFILKIMKSNGSVPQIGDNDSGRFLKLLPVYMEFNNNEDFQIDNFNPNLNSNENTFSQIIENLSDWRNVLEIYSRLSDLLTLENSLENTTEATIIPAESKIFNYAYEKFGIFIYKSYYYQAVIRCGSIGQGGKGGHAHNDQLSIVLNIKGNDFLVDPGTYLYTALPKIRNQYRSTSMHNTLSINSKEQNDWLEDSTNDLFWMLKEKSLAKPLKIEDNLFIGEHYGFGFPHRRELKFGINTIDGTDICESEELKMISFHLAPEVEVDYINPFEKVALSRNKIIIEISSTAGNFSIEEYKYSQSYGVIKSAKRVILHTNLSKSDWKVEIVTI